MFFKLTVRNSRRSRKENRLFFAALLIAIIAFYMILSLSSQDVMIFLAKMESDAVSKLLTMIPVFYGMTLFLLFFLIYFASKFQLERRRHEFGVYLMMGMRRYKLFMMLLIEDLGSSMAALAAGLPMAVLLAEIVSLVTARMVGMGIIGHRFSISFSAILWTVIGFMVIKLVAFLILSGKIARQEIGQLLVEVPEAEKKPKPAVFFKCMFFTGLTLLVYAYAMAITGLAWVAVGQMAETLVIGTAGTFLLFYGLRVLMNALAKHSGTRHGLHVFTFRQLQETVIWRSGTLAVSSLLILAALCCFASGVSMVLYYGGSSQHVLDYTFEQQTTAGVKDVLKEHQMENAFSEIFDMNIGMIRTSDDYEHAFQMKSVTDALEQLPETPACEVLLSNFSYETYPYLISLHSYNQLLSAAGQPGIGLAEHEAALYISSEFTDTEKTGMLNQILAENLQVSIDNEDYKLTGTVQTDSLVTDRSITISFALILSDEAFMHFTEGDYSTYVNAVLSENVITGNSLMNAISETNEKLDKTGLIYESFLKNMGRQLFYVVAASYITIYLAIIFLTIANTIIGVQFLTSQQRTGRRYQTLIRLGAGYSVLCQSASKQIRWYFGIPVIMAAMSSIFGIWGLLSGIVPSRSSASMTDMLLMAAVVILLLGVVEYFYIHAVRKASDKNILKLMVPEREE